MKLRFRKYYRAKNEWAIFDVDVFGPSGVTLMIHSSFGSWAYTWVSTGLNPFKFMVLDDLRYYMDKLTGHQLFVWNKEKAFEDLRKSILTERREDPVTYSKHAARELWDELNWIEGDTGSKDTFYHAMNNITAVEEFFGDCWYEAIPDGEIVDPGLQRFWDLFTPLFNADMKRMAKRWDWVFPIWEWFRARKRKAGGWIT